MNDFRQFDQESFSVDYLGDGVRYRLPRRRLGRARHLGWIVVAVGLVMTMFMIGWMSGPIMMGIKDLQKGAGDGWFAIGFSCFGLLGLVPALGIFMGGFAIVCNRTRCEIEVRRGRVTVKERFFLARIKRKRDIAGIHELRVSDASEHSVQNQRPQESLHHAAVWLGNSDNALLAITGHKGKFLIAAAYPRDLLLRLAEELAPRLEADLNVQTTIIERAPSKISERESSHRKVSVFEGPIEEEEIQSVPNQPADSTARIERRDYGITMEIPPVGLWRGSKGLFFFALIWNVFMSIFIVVGTLGAMGAIEVEGDGPPWLMLVIISPFVAVGISLMVTAINMGRRHATIATADDLLMIVRYSIFGPTTREWWASQIDEICCGNSGMEMNDVPVKELQIVPFGEKKFGCLSQLDNDELQWIAAELNQTLGTHRSSEPGGLQFTAVHRDDSGFATPSPGSRVAIERTIDGLQLNVPPVGLLKYAGLVVFGFIFAVIGVGIAIGVNWDAVEHGIGKLRLSEALFASAFLFGFGGIGFAVMCIGLVAGRRRFQFQVEHNELTLVRRGPFLRKTFRWQRDDLDSIAVKDSGTRFNNRSLYQVYIRSAKGDSVGIMTGHEKRDLALVTTALNESLGIVESER